MYVVCITSSLCLTEALKLIKWTVLVSLVLYTRPIPFLSQYYEGKSFLHKYSIMCATLNSTLLLLVWGFSSHSWVFYSFGEVSITSELLQIWTYTRHSWPLSSEGSLLCRTYCDMGQPFIYNGHLRGPMTLHNCICRVSVSGHEEQRRLPGLHLILSAASDPLLTFPGLVQWLIKGDQ